MLIFSAVAEIAAGFMLLQLMLHQPGQYLFMAYVYCGLHLPARCLMPESAASPKQVCALSRCSVCIAFPDFAFDNCCSAAIAQWAMACHLAVSSLAAA